MVAASVAELPMLGGHPGLDLVNTVEPRIPVSGRHDHLNSPDALLAWAQRAGQLDRAESHLVADAWASSLSTADQALETTKQIRESLSTVLSAFLSADTAAENASQALEYLSLRWAAAAARAQLALGRPGGPAASLRLGSAPALMIPDRCAFAAVELLTDVDLTHLGFCPPARGGCGWLFIDRSRSNTRRWCSMDGCGAAAKAHRLTERRRAVRASSKRPSTK